MNRRFLAFSSALGAAVVAAVPITIVVGLGADSANAASCSTSSTITVTGANLKGLTVKPAQAKATTAQCVNVTNNSNTAGKSVTVAIYRGSQEVADATIKQGFSKSFSPLPAGDYKIKAQDGFPTDNGSDSLSVATASTSNPTHSASSAPTRHGRSTPTTGPDVAPSPRGKHHKGGGKADAGPSPTFSLPPIPGLSTVSPSAPPGSQPLVAPGETPSDQYSLMPQPTGSTSSADAAPAASKSSNGGGSKGLPAAVACVLILGTGFGMLRIRRRRT